MNRKTYKTVLMAGILFIGKAFAQRGFQPRQKPSDEGMINYRQHLDFVLTIKTFRNYSRFGGIRTCSNYRGG